MMIFNIFCLYAILAVHTSGILVGAFMNKGAVKCGPLICRPISELYTDDPSSGGYHHVATIPIGASNISITEVKNTKNLLVLKTSSGKYVINGDYKFSSSGIYEAAGSVFDYRRIDDLLNTSAGGSRLMDGVTEWITSIGPTIEPIEIMVQKYDKNPGIKYEYLLPINAVENSEEESTEASVESAGDLRAGNAIEDPAAKPSKKRKFQWKLVGFTPCSKSCGGGVQTPVFRCIREAPNKYYKQTKCAHMKKPSLEDSLLQCNVQPCPAYWQHGDWNKCNCGVKEPYQSREVKCVQELSTGLVLQVNNQACLDDVPATRQPCECPKASTSDLAVYRYRNRKNNRHKNNGTESHRHRGHSIVKQPVYQVVNSSISKRANQDINKKAGVWLTSDWMQECHGDCEEGIQHRSIFCDRSPPTTDRCDFRLTPDTSRFCKIEKEKCDAPEWFTGPWKPCTGDCFNLTKSRLVYCIQRGEILSDDDCDENKKPETNKECALEEVTDCKPKWLYSEWSECTRPCNGGTQRRTVKCFEPNLNEKILQESDRCKYSERPSGYRECNDQECDSTEYENEPRVDLLQNDIEPGCVDGFANCHVVIKQKLCSYNYYKKHCCASCKAQNHI